MNSFSKRHETLSNAAWFLAISASKFLISVLRRAADAVFSSILRRI